jgi:hypothetical protein
MEEVEALTKRFLAEGYEGAIARKDGAGYRYSYSGYHSSGLLKIKPLFDSEFAVVGFTQGTSGKDVGALVWVCEVPEEGAPDPADRAFNVVPKNMTYADRYALFRCLGARGPDGRTRFERTLKGLPLTVEYPELSAKTGKPVQAKATVFRTYEGEGGAAGDPVRRLLAECAGGGGAGGGPDDADGDDADGDDADGDDADDGGDGAAGDGADGDYADDGGEHGADD